jgi:photosystem II stability/assembly factor-like uncharacterized protein
MRKSIFILLCFGASHLFAQTRHTDFFRTKRAINKDMPEWAVLMYGENPHVPTVDSLFRAWRETHPTDKTTDTQNFKQWRRGIKNFVDTEGYITRLGEHDALLRMPIVQKKEGITGGNWTPVGPTDLFDQSNRAQAEDSHANVFSIDVSMSDANVLYCGTEAGGIYKTTDKGVNWTLMTANYPIGQVQAIRIHPTNPNIAFAATWGTLFRTTDGGTTWNAVYSDSEINDIAFHPTSPNIVFIATNNSLRRSTTAGSDGSFVSVIDNQSFDIKFKTDDPSVVFALVDDPTEKICKFYKSTDAGASFTVRSTGWLSLTTAANPLAARSNQGGRMAISAANSGRIYAYLIGETKSGDGGQIGLWRSDNAGENWTMVSPWVGAPYSSTNQNYANYHSTIGDDFWQGFYNLAMMASPTNADVLLLGNLSLYRSTNAGVTMTPMGGYQGSTGIHPDFQGMAVNGSESWLSCDGGIRYSTDFFATNYQVRDNGINAAEYWGFGQGWNQDIMVGGRYHNGNAVLNSTYPTGKAIFLGGGEAATGYVNPSTNVAYFSDMSGRILPNDFNGSVSNTSGWTKYPDESYYAANASDAEFDPRYYKHIYIGQTKSLWKSTDNGLTFNELKNFDNGNADCRIREIEVSRSNPNYIYVYVGTSSQGASLFRSTDGGATWTEKAFPTTTNKREGSITLSATDENKLWVMFTNGDDDAKVYATTNAGTTCTWTNISSPLFNGQPLQTILNQLGTNDLYIGSSEKVYRYTSGTWETFNAGLPAYTPCNLLRGYYRGNKLRLSTYGYGIWETPFAVPSPPVAQPMVDKTTSDCGRTAFLFDDYSVAKSDATYAWSFSPTPQYVSSPTARNPQVIFGAVGSYSATLTVTDANGTSTKTVPNMVSITTDNCAIQTTPTSSGTFAGTQTSYARASAAPNFGTSQDFSVGFWFKSATTSGSAAMVTDKNFFNKGFNGWAFALNSGGRVQFNVADEEGHQINIYSTSGLNDNKWHHAAASVTRTGNAVLYVDGLSAGSTSAAALLSINSSYPICMGLDGAYNYVYAGDIDEVKIWDVALTQAQIREKMHVTAPNNEANLINYYQFNESTTNEYDRGSNSYNLIFSSTATRSTSTAPVGGGTVFRTTVNAAGMVDFTGTNCQINFAGSTLPNGEIVVSALNVSPDQNPTAGNALSNKYWVVDNYGTNAGLTLSSMSFSNLGSFVAGGTPNNYKLFKRSSNAHGATWGTSIDAADVITTTNNNTLTFSTGNGITSFSQFTLMRDVVLKVELLNFNAVLKDKQVNLTWQVADEKDVNHYIIERSFDGKTFDFLQKQEKGKFSITDGTPQYGANYYRLKVVENDGQFTYSPIRSVNFESGKKTEFKVYPNPTADVLNLQFDADRAQNTQIELFDNLGKLVHSYDFTSKEGNNHLFFNTQRFAAGLYTLKIQQRASVVVEKVVIR